MFSEPFARNPEKEINIFPHIFLNVKMFFSEEFWRS
jgi:hypothetical protein